MNISKISIAQPSFKAKTTISAPESLLKKEDRTFFEELGSKIGQNTDTIDISISELQTSKKASNVIGYQFRQSVAQKRENSASSYEFSCFVPYVKNGVVNSAAEPKMYLASVFSKLVDKLFK